MESILLNHLTSTAHKEKNNDRTKRQAWVFQKPPKTAPQTSVVLRWMRRHQQLPIFCIWLTAWGGSVVTWLPAGFCLGYMQMSSLKPQATVSFLKLRTDPCVQLAPTICACAFGKVLRKGVKEPEEIYRCFSFSSAWSHYDNLKISHFLSK